MSTQDAVLLKYSSKTQITMSDRIPNRQGKPLPLIKPKSSVEDEFIMSKIHVSKNWKLPPTSAYTSMTTRKRRSPSASISTPSPANSPSPNNGNGSKHSTAEDIILKKQKQNRDAQRAYRERKEKRMKEMESVIESLQEKVKYWQRLYQSKCNEVIHLENKYNQLVDYNGLTSQETDVYNLIDSFKPMKPVPLLPTRITTQQMIPNTPVSIQSSINYPTFLPQTNVNLPIAKPLVPIRPMPMLANSIPKVKKPTKTKSKCGHNHNHNHNHGHKKDKSTPSSCGFCSESVSCICNELTETTNDPPSKTGLDQSSNDESSNNGSDMLLGKEPLALALPLNLPLPTTESLFLPQLDRITTKEQSKLNPPAPKPLPPMTIAQLTCSSDPHTCTKCSDINETCIKSSPATTDNNNNNKNNTNNNDESTKYIPNEIDFTNFKP